VQKVTEWVLHPCKSDHANCAGVHISNNPITANFRGVYIFNSEYWGEKIKSKSKSKFKKKSNQNRIKRKKHNHHITDTNTSGKPLIPTDGAPDATAARAYSICTSLPDGLTT